MCGAVISLCKKTSPALDLQVVGSKEFSCTCISSSICPSKTPPGKLILLEGPPTWTYLGRTESLPRSCGSIESSDWHPKKLNGFCWGVNLRPSKATSVLQDGSAHSVSGHYPIFSLYTTHTFNPTRTPKNSSHQKSLLPRFDIFDLSLLDPPSFRPPTTPLQELNGQLPLTAHRAGAQRHFQQLLIRSQIGLRVFEKTQGLRRERMAILGAHDVSYLYVYKTH